MEEEEAQESCASYKVGDRFVCLTDTEFLRNCPRFGNSTRICLQMGRKAVYTFDQTISCGDITILEVVAIDVWPTGMPGYLCRRVVPDERV
jgi:hypothetical protein